MIAEIEDEHARPLCPECGLTLEIQTDPDDDDPAADAWTCEACGVMWSNLPLPAGYVKAERAKWKAAMAADALECRQKDDRAKLAAWNCVMALQQEGV